MPAPDGVLGRCAPALLAASPRPPTHAPYPARAPARVLFPMASAPAAAAAIRAYTTPATAGGGLALGAAAGLARLGATRLAPRPLALGGPGTFLEHLQSLFPERMEFCVHPGPPRANRKPVVRVPTPARRSVPYVTPGV